MRTVLRIFWKDVRRLWPMIALVLAIHALSIYLNRPFSYRDMISEALDLAVNIAPLLLTLAVIHGEALCDQRQFWLTRPYDWKTLLASKALFIFVFVNVPFFLADIIRSAISHLPLVLQLSHLLWRQICLTGWLVLSAAAVAAVTANLVQAVLACLGCVLIAAATSYLGRGGDWGRLEWIPRLAQLAVLAAATIAATWIEYRARRTAIARTVLAVGFLLMLVTAALVPWTTAFALQSRLSGTAPEAERIQLAFDMNGWNGPGFVVGYKGLAAIRLPIQLTGLPQGMRVSFDTGRVRLRSPGAPDWDPGWGNQIVDWRAGEFPRVLMAQDQYKSRKDRPFEFHGSFALTVLAESPVAHVSKPGRIELPTGETCFVDGWFEDSPLVRCQSFSGRFSYFVAARNLSTGKVIPARQLGPVRSYGPNPMDIEPVPYTFDMYRLPTLALPSEQWLGIRSEFQRTPGKKPRWAWVRAPEKGTAASRVRDSFSSGVVELVFIAERPVAHIVREFTASGARLADFHAQTP